MPRCEPVTAQAAEADLSAGLTPEHLVMVMHAFSEGLELHRNVVNRLNVYRSPTAIPAPTWPSRSRAS